LELISAYAYHQNKFLEKKVHLGEGLVGMCAKERQPVIIKDVPGNYIFIKSAFGGTVPQNIVLIPLIFNDLVYGVLELATLAEFENYKVEFLEQLAENIANTLAIDETNEQTKKLLEQTQKQSQELLSREEELRQNLEELQSTQDRFLLNQAEMNSYMNALNLNQMVFELNASFLITHTNANFADFLELPTDVLFKFAIDTALGFDSKLLDELKRSIFNGDVYTLKHTLVVGNKNKRFKAVLSPVFNDRSVLVKIVGVGYEIV
jgi:methyl-accepting chemotaxis protein